jgi:hypothetical protein
MHYYKIYNKKQEEEMKNPSQILQRVMARKLQTEYPAL